MLFSNNVPNIRIHLQNFRACRGIGLILMHSDCFAITEPVLFVYLFTWTPSFEGNWVSLMEFSLTSGAGVDDNAPYQDLQITTLANP